MSSDTAIIPKILHQLWIGDQTKRPSKLMETWRSMHPDWEYISWSEAEIERRNMRFECSRQIADIPEINGKADIMRWEILYEMGGVFMDADSICLEALDPQIFLTKNGFSCFENEQNRRGLVACGAMGFPPKHPLLREIIDHIHTLDLRPQVCNLKAWMTVAVKLITEKLDSGKYPDFTIFPSYMFIPHHFTGVKYQGHKRVYAYQAWGSTYQSYQMLNGIGIPPDLLPPPHDRWCSILISSYNTRAEYVEECLDSIRAQIGHIGFEVVWINDGSDAEHTAALRAALARFEGGARFVRVKYHETAENRGIAAALYDGVEMCSHEIIIKMDSDDIMKYNRVARQLEFMEKTPDCVICGANVHFFSGTGAEKRFTTQTNHPAMITWQQYRAAPSAWFFNHPTMCVRRSAVIKAGNYNKSLSKTPFEDFELELRIMRRFGKVYNLPDVLLNYRIHEGQVTHKMNADPEKWSGLRARILQTYLGGEVAAHPQMKMGF